MEENVTNDDFVELVKRAKAADIPAERLRLDPALYDAWEKGEKLPQGQFSRHATVKAIKAALEERARR
jgi:hypothetical protein